MIRKKTRTQKNVQESQNIAKVTDTTPRSQARKDDDQVEQESGAAQI